MLYEGARYEERGPAVSAKSKRTGAAQMIKGLRHPQPTQATENDRARRQGFMGVLLEAGR